MRPVAVFQQLICAATPDYIYIKQTNMLGDPLVVFAVDLYSLDELCFLVSGPIMMILVTLHDFVFARELLGALFKIPLAR